MSDQAPSAPSPTSPAWEAVHHVTNYFDFPLEGLADFQGSPHVFFLQDEVRRPDPEVPGEFETGTIYALHPASAELVADLTEKHAIFERWHQAWSQDKSLIKQHPALPAERPRYDTLQVKVKRQLAELRQSPAGVIREGNFARKRRPVLPGQSDWQSFQVQWVD